MKISEIFFSIQGEGILLGVPSLFVRTSGCNLRCTWCDTPYTSWRPEGEELSSDEIAAQVAGFHASHVVITGGEPMIAPEIVCLTNRLRTLASHITIETAGTVYTPVECDLMSISPKLSNSTPREREGGRWAAQHDRTRFQPEILRRLMTEYVYQLKFVVSSEKDLHEVAAMRDELDVPPSKIILMPEGIDREVLRERGLWLAEVCKLHNYRYSPRLHIDLWGDRRGV
jgi:7-carboxy-7-deazaguanine synthase